MNPRLVVIGSLNADFVIRVPRFPLAGETVAGEELMIFPGGKGANQACGVARLGGQVSMIGQVGDDAHADFLLGNLASAGVDVSHISRQPQISTGMANILIDGEGQNQIVIVPGANGTFGVERLQDSRELIASAGVVLLQLEIPIQTVLAAARLARESGATVILDPAPAQEIPDTLLGCVDYLTPNETELSILTGTRTHGLEPNAIAELARSLQSRGAREVIVKMGSQGALLLGERENCFWPALPVKVVDSTAAGDAFNAAFAFALASGQSEFQAGRFATAAAAYSVTQAGAQPSLPTRAQVDSMSEQRP